MSRLTTLSSAAPTHAGGGLRSRLTSIIDALGRFPLAIHQGLFRLAIAGVFLKAGLTKVASWEMTAAARAIEHAIGAAMARART